MAALRVESLHKRFGRRVAVQDVSLTVEPGQLFALLGPNGSGKTTTLACALGLLRPDGGRVEILGLPAARIHETAGRVAAVFDAPTLVPGLTVGQNLAYAERLLGHSGGRDARELLDLVGMGDFAARRVEALSLGQRRRVSIARALLGRPEILVLDEPLSGLDTLGVRSMLALFARLASESLTLLVSSHRLHEMERIATHAAILVAGRVLRAGPLADFLATGPERLEVTASPAERAREILGVLPGVTLVDVAADAPDATHARDAAHADARFLLDLDGVSPAAVNHALVAGGCAVSALAARRKGLLDVFEELLDAEGAKERA